MEYTNFVTERKLTDEIDFDDVISELADRKVQKILLSVISMYFN